MSCTVFNTVIFIKCFLSQNIYRMVQEYVPAVPELSRAQITSNSRYTVRGMKGD